MVNYKIGDLVETKRGDKVVLIDFIEDNKKVIGFNLSKMHPDKLDINEIKKKVNNPNCKIIIEKVNIENEEETEETEEIEEIEETEEIEKTEETENNMKKALEELLTSIFDEFFK